MYTMSVVAACSAPRIWAIYAALRWQEWDHDIAAMTANGPLADATVLTITMRDGKTHVATLRDVRPPECFSYTAPLPGGATLVATHELQPAPPHGTTITHSFGFTGLLGGLFRLVTANYVQNGLRANTAALRAMAEEAAADAEEQQ